MKSNKQIEKIVNWAESTRTSAARRGMIAEIRNGLMVVTNREHTVALVSPIPSNENLKFYTDEYPLGKYPDITIEGDKVVFSWEEKNQNRKVSFPLPQQSYFDEVLKTFEIQKQKEGINQQYKTQEFLGLLEEIKFTTLETTPTGMRMSQTDPRGIVSTTEIKSESGIVKQLEEW